MRASTGIACAALAALLGCLSPVTARADSVTGVGIIRHERGAVDGTNFYTQVSVNAYLDANGHPQGSIRWQGDVINVLPGGNVGPGGPTDPYIMDVVYLEVVGNTAYVTGLVVASPAGTGNANGSYVSFAFTDNSAAGLPDVLTVYGLGSAPIDSGGYDVDD